MKAFNAALLSGAVLATILIAMSSGNAHAAQTCTCIQKKTVVARHAPARKIYRNADAEYAQSYYDYRSSSQVGRVVYAGPAAGAPVAIRKSPWVIAPNDARIRFWNEGYQGGYQGGGEQMGYVGPDPEQHMVLNDREFTGGVGYGADSGGGGGGGYGGQAFLYGGQGGGQSAPSNGGGVNLPPGYGRDYHGNWQGYVPPGQMAQPGK